MTPDHGFIAPLLGTMLGKKQEARERSDSDSAFDSLFVGAVEVLALIAGFRVLKSATENDIMGVIGALVFASTATEMLCELSHRIVLLPRNENVSVSLPPAASVEPVRALPEPLTRQAQNDITPHIVYSH